MRLPKLIPSLSFCLLFTLCAVSQDTIGLNPKDTITYNESNSQKVLALGQLIEDSAFNNQPDSLISKWYKNVFIKRVLDLNPSINQNKDYLDAFIIGVKKGVDKFPNEIISEVQNGAYYDFINYRYDHELQTYYVLFRLYSAVGGMNYHDYRVHKNGDEMMFSDIYIYLSGEELSKTMARVMGYVIPDKKILGMIQPAKKEGVDQLFQTIKFKNSGNFKMAYQLLKGITSEISKEKFFLIFKTLIASNLDDDIYLAALEELISTYPNDPTIVLNKIDYHIYKENYFEAIQVINQLQEYTEDDFLNFLKANVAFMDKNYDFALNNYKYTIQNYPDFFEGQAGYLSTLVLMKKFKDATTYIDTLIEDGYDRDDLINYIEEDDINGENILDILVASKTYKTWKLNAKN